MRKRQTLANSLQIEIFSFVNIKTSITYKAVINIWKACIPPKGIRGSNPRLSAFPVKKRKLIMASFFAFITKITGMSSLGRTCSVRNPMVALANPMRWANRFFCVYFRKLRAFIYLVAMPLWHHSEKESGTCKTLPSPYYHRLLFIH